MRKRNKWQHLGHVVKVAAVTLVLAACSELVDPTDPSQVRILSFEAHERNAQPGLYRLTWRVSGLEDGTLTLEPGINGQPKLDVTARTEDGTGEIDVEPEQTTTYKLTAASGSGSSQTTSATVRIEVVVPGAPQLSSFSADPPEVNPGFPATLSWSASNYDSLRLEGPGLGEGVDVAGTGSYEVTPTAGADYRLVATNDVTSIDATLEDVGRSVPAATFLIAGQSNAQGRNVELNDPSDAADLGIVAADDAVRMLGNDYVWKSAYEPLDDCTGQVDSVSQDPSSGECVAMGNSGVSFGVSLGNEVHQATGGTVFLIPAAKGGSTAAEWRPQNGLYNRSSLFGSAAHRARLAKEERAAPVGFEHDGKEYGAIVWFQGEAETNTFSEASNFKSRTDEILDAFQAELAAPVFVAQLGRIVERHYGSFQEQDRNLLMQRVRQDQLDLESDSDGRYLVVTHDLPLHDRNHLSAEAQVELGRRVGLAVREHLLGEAGVDGTGPRYTGHDRPDTSTVRVNFDRTIRAPTTSGAGAYSGYFAVFANDTELAISSIDRGDGTAGENTAVHITLSSPQPGDVEVRYLPPEGVVTSATQPEKQLNTLLADVVRSASCAEPMPGFGGNLCLPAPAFGTATGGVDLTALRFMDLYVE